MDIQKLTNDKIFKLLDERYKKKNILYEHLHNSYNELINNIIHYMQTSDNIFSESKVNDLIYKYSFKYENLQVRPATIDNGDELLYPMDAINKKITYSVKIIAKITQIQEIYKLNTKEVISIKTIGQPTEQDMVVQLPLMVHSKYCSLEINKNHTQKECKYNPGGYFIVNGNEKVVMCIEKMIENKPLVFTKKDGEIITYQIQLHSRSSNPNIMMQTMQIRIKKNYDILINVPILNEISVFVLIRALGIETDKEMVNYITYNENDIDMVNILKISINSSKKDDNNLILNREDALNTLGNNKIKVIKKFADKTKKLSNEEKREHLEFLLKNAFMPHINNEHHNDVLKVKGIFLCMMVNKLLNCYLGRTQPDDRDSFLNKRIETPGDLIFESYKQNYKKVLSDCNKIFTKRVGNNHTNPLNIINQIKPNTIKQGIESSMMTGNWGNKTGVAQPYQRLTYFQSCELLRRVDAPTVDASKNKLLGPRHYNPSQVGMLCCVESPEHAKIGMVKHLTLISSITFNNKEQGNLLYDLLKNHKYFIHMNNHSPLNIIANTKIFLNGEWIGFSNNALELYNELKELKLLNVINKTTGIIYDIVNKEIKICTDGGRLYRSILKVKNNEILLTDKIIDEVLINESKINKWDYLMTKYPETIDIIDGDEQLYALIAYDYSNVHASKKSEQLIYEDTNIPIINRYDESLICNYTHCEIHPQLLIGIIASNIPFANHNYGPRNMFQYAQGKQAMGIYASNYRYRADISYLLEHCQKALVNTYVSKYTNANILPNGENAIVAIGSYTGHNIEDSIVFNESSVHRGLFRSITFKEWESEIEKNQSTSQNDIFTKPDQTKLFGYKDINYNKLNDFGYVPEETFIENNDVIIGKVTPIQPQDGSNKCFKDSSVIYKGQENAIISKVFSGITNSEGYEMIRVKTSSERIPKIGDKMCSKHGNKGTIGLLLHQSDMPFTENGMSPDLIINPIGVVGRKTIGQLLECTMGKIASIKCMIADGTSFNQINTNDMFDELESLGFKRNGTEVMYNGITGQKLKLPIFVGPTYYQRLKHLVMDKIHCLKTEGTEILTLNGWKKYGKFSLNDKVAILKNNKLIYENPINIFYYPEYKNKLYSVKNKNIELNVTLNHRMWVSSENNPSQYKFAFVSDIVNKKVNYKKDAIWDVADYQFIMPEYEQNIVMNDFIILLAFIIKNGYVNTNNIKLNLDKITNEVILFNTLENLNLKYHIISNILFIDNGYYIKYFKNYYSNGQLYFPEWVMNLSKNQSNILIKYIDIANLNSLWEFNDEKLADQFMHLTLHAGYITNKIFIDNKWLIEKSFQEINEPYEEQIYEYNGSVFCLEVSTGVFMVRTNGKACWTGNSRARGTVTMLTRQPPEGRSKDGGLRIGEMERDCMIAHGLSKFLKERLLDVSDSYTCHVCNKCGMFAQRIINVNYQKFPMETDIYKCKACNTGNEIFKVTIPYCFKLLLQELLAMGIAGRIHKK
jgi:DNA-directed RNA polymerase II subunit RPB2